MVRSSVWATGPVKSVTANAPVCFSTLPVSVWDLQSQAAAIAIVE
jgi:hypothetical protein